MLTVANKILIIRFNFSLQDFQECYNNFMICLTYNNIRYLKYTFKNNFQCKLVMTMILVSSVFFRTYTPHVAHTDLEGLSFFVPAHVYFSQQIKSINNWQPCSTAFLLISLFFSVSDELVCVRMCVWVCVCVCALNPFGTFGYELLVAKPVKSYPLNPLHIAHISSASLPVCTFGHVCAGFSWHAAYSC